MTWFLKAAETLSLTQSFHKEVELRICSSPEAFYLNSCIAAIIRDPDSNLGLSSSSCAIASSVLRQTLGTCINMDQSVNRHTHLQQLVHR